MFMFVFVFIFIFIFIFVLVSNGYNIFWVDFSFFTYHIICCRRGTDFGYLGRIFTNLKRPGDDDAIFHDVDDVAIPNAIPKPNRALNALRDLYDDLVPRWQGVVHTAEAAIETPSSTRRRSSSLPWADIKFSHYIERGRKKAASGSERFRKWVEGSLPAAGEPLSAKELARYKYHIDLGGGGTSSDIEMQILHSHCIERCAVSF